MKLSLLLGGLLAGTGARSVVAMARGPAPIDPEERILAVLRTEGLLDLGKDSYVIMTRRMDGNRLLDPVLRHRDAAGKTDLIVLGRAAEIHVNKRRGQVIITIHNGEGWAGDGTRMYFGSRTWVQPLPNEFVVPRP